MFRRLPIALCLAASPVLAQEVPYCVDTDAVGFRWKEGRASSGKFAPDRYTIKLVSPTQRIMTRMVGDTAGVPQRYTCRSLQDDDRP